MARASTSAKESYRSKLWLSTVVCALIVAVAACPTLDVPALTSDGAYTSLEYCVKAISAMWPPMVLSSRDQKCRISLREDLKLLESGCCPVALTLLQLSGKGLHRDDAQSTSYDQADRWSVCLMPPRGFDAGLQMQTCKISQVALPTFVCMTILCASQHGRSAMKLSSVLLAKHLAHEL